MTSRRRFLIGAIAAAAFASLSAAASHRRRSLADIEAKYGGRLGLYALNTSTGQDLSNRPDERFAMCSTFKWLLAAEVLARADRAELSLDEHVPYGAPDLLEYAPITREHLPEGSMSIAALAQAAVTVSDNTAANLLLTRIGGPSSLTQFVRPLGDPVTRLDRNEPGLNSNDPGDPRDTTSPRAQVHLMSRILCGDALSAASRDRLLGWLRACETGKERLRAGLPQSWLVGDKTGTGRRGAINDVAIATPPGREPILIAAYLSEGNPERAAATHAEVGRLVASEL